MSGVLRISLVFALLGAWTTWLEAAPKRKMVSTARPAPYLRQREEVVPDPPIPPASDLPVGTSDPDAILPVQRLDGIVAGPPRREDFFLRANGFVYLVRPHSPGLLAIIAGGDGVRVYGTINGLNVSNANVRVLRKRASSRWDDYSFNTFP
jgi:hypothetical protein